MKHLIVLAALLCSNFAFSQEMDIDFGEVSKSDLEMTVYAADSSAAAVVLYEKGKSYFRFNQTDLNLDLTLETHVRIKILKKEALDRGTFTIPLYHRDLSEERVTSYKGYTFNLEKGKVKKSKLRKSNRFIEEVNKYNDRHTYTFPDVKVGSVIDFKYTKTSDFAYNLEDWYFQSDIPVVWSEYIVKIPEYYNYYKNNKGYISPYIYDNTSKNVTHSIVQKSRSGYMVTKTEYSSNQLSYLETTHRFVYKDVPAFKNEAYVGADQDYLAQVSFELQSIKYPNSQLKSYSNSYESISRELLNDSRFGDQLNSKRFINYVVDEINASASDETQKMDAAYEWVKNNIKWNEYNGIYATEGIKEVYEKREGNAGGINLLLTTLLRALEIDANPVILSTRSNGHLPVSHPSISSFNYTISHVKIGDKEYLLDATSPFLAINQLPSRCLNDKGRLVNEKGGRWIELTKGSKFVRNELIQASFNEDGDLVGKRRITNGLNAGYRKREAIFEDGGEEKYFESYQELNPDFIYENYSLKNFDNESTALIEQMDFSIHVHDNDDVVYFNPLLSFKIDENPFVQEERIYPVEFQFPKSYKYMISLTVPDGYLIDELPESAVTKLPDNAGVFSYLIRQNGKKLMLTCQISLNKQMFLPTEYQYLKEFYKTILDRQSQLIVLKRDETWEEKI